MVGLIPLYAVEVLEPEALDRLPGFKRRMQWFLDNVPNVPHHIEMTQKSRRWNSPAALHCQPQKTGEDASLHAG